MPLRHPSVVARSRTFLLTLALAAGGLGGVGFTAQSASADSSDQLVVVDTTNATTQGLSGATILTVNADGSATNSKPVPLPTADSGAAKAFALSGDSNGNGALALSADATSLSVAGYHAVPGPTGVVGFPDPKDTTAAQIQRMVARISATGGTASVDTSTVLSTNTLSTSAPRAAVSTDGQSFYVSGNGGSDVPVAGVIKVPLGGASKVAITDNNQKNVRQVQIAGNQLYATSDKNTLAGFGRFANAGLPTSSTAITQLGGPIVVAASPTKDYVPDAMLLLHTGANSSSSTVIDTAYVVIDTDTSKGVAGEIRKYISTNGTTWTKQASAKTGDYPFLTGRVSAGVVQLYLTKGSSSANKIVEVDDTTPTGDFTAGSETTVAQAAAGHAFRGVSLPPTGWNPGTVSSSAPTISADNSTVGGTIGDANNPTQDVNLVDSDTPAVDLTVTATSSNPAVLPNANITLTGTGATRTAKFVPIARGRSTVTFTVKDLQNNVGTTQVFYAASNSPASASGHYFYESSDLSSAIDVGDGYTLAVSSEDSTMRLYKQNQSGRPVKTFDMGGAGATGIGNGGGDLEGMARVGDLIYVIGSHGNNSDGDPKPNRRVLFSASITGSGATTDVSYIGKYTGLWDALRTWDQSNGNRLKFAAGQATGVPANDTNGFNIEGIEFAPGSTSTAYLGFRSPLITHSGKPSAVIVPVTNADSLILGGAAPAFGDPIYLDLGGRTIREIRKNSDDEYLITAQADPPTSPQWKLYAWDGNPADSPVAVKSLDDPTPATTGSWESIVSVPHPLASGASVSLVADSGDSTYYGDATHATDESKGLQKSYTDAVTLDSFTSFPTAPHNVQAAKTTDGSISVTWDPVGNAASYVVTVKDGSTNVPGSPKTVNAPATSTTFSGLSSKPYTVTVTAKNAMGESGPSTPAQTVTPDDKLVNATKPTITGTPAIDQTLTVGPGTWTPGSGVSFAYQWSAGGVDIDGATGTTLVLGADQVGKTITVTETASKPGSTSVSATSTATAAVASGQFLTVAKPTIAGNPQVGQALIASGGSSLPAADTFTYEWFGSDDPSTPIPGATTSTFTPTTAQVGKTITVRVVAHKAGYADQASTKSDATGVVDPTAVSNSVKPSITGSPAVDSTLTAHDGTWEPAGVSFAYQWLADGNEITDATSGTFTPTAAELGKKITVRVTGSKTNLSPYQAESDETAPVAAAPVVNQSAPVLSGTAREGQQLSTTDGTWTPASGLSYAYQWKANGTAIAGAADANTYTLTSDEVGKVITVEVTASKAGYSAGKKTSNASDAVDPSAVSNTVAPSIPAAAVIGTPITVDQGTWQPTGVSFTYQWLADGSAIANANAATFTPTAAEFGKKISVTVTGSKGALTSLDKTSNETTPVTTAVVNNSAPAISGQAIEGKTLTTTDGSWTPTPDSYTYVWKSGGNVIAGESTNQLVVPSGAAGSTITVEVTAAKTGYLSGVKSSAPTGAVDPSAVSNVTLPSIPTTPVVGAQVTADHGAWNPAGVSYAYQWLADGSDIANATSQSFTPTVNETGKKLSVKVTASKTGLTSASATSAETAAVTGLPPVFGTPTNLTVAGTTASTITVTWTKSTDAVKYRLYIGIGTGSRTKLEVGNVNTATFTGLKPNQAYTIDISAFKANGTQSAYGPSPRLVGTTAPLTAPTDLSPTVRAGTSIALSWTKVPGVKNYRITYGIGTGKRTTVNLGDVDTYNITGLKHNQAYSIDVASLALDKKTVSPASPRINPSTSALLPPTSFKVTGVTATTVTLSWTKAANAASYRIYYGIGTGVRTRVEVGDVNTATITGLTKGKKYSIDMASVEPDGVGRSSYTTRINATTK